MSSEDIFTSLDIAHSFMECRIFSHGSSLAYISYEGKICNNMDYIYYITDLI